VVREAHKGERFRPHSPASLHHYWPTADLPTGRAEVSRETRSVDADGGRALEISRYPLFKPDPRKGIVAGANRGGRLFRLVEI
jgi:hypothetical protein